ncbi:hypothetical protein [Bosea sp. UC22_33]|uniref:hypothetical protein n=1 Tax=Bosea sp. UC22_33 TaxID=3350165 RepID=UPI003671C13F
MSTILVRSFNRWIGWALGDLAHVAGRDTPRSRRAGLQSIKPSVTNALRFANAMGCPARKAMCLRVLNWLNAEIRRLPA